MSLLINSFVKIDSRLKTSFAIKVLWQNLYLQWNLIHLKIKWNGYAIASDIGSKHLITRPSVETGYQVQLRYL